MLSLGGRASEEIIEMHHLQRVNAAKKHCLSLALATQKGKRDYEIVGAETPL